MMIEPGAIASSTGTPPRPEGVRDLGTDPDDGHRPEGNAGDERDFEPGDVPYFPRGHGHSARMPGRRATHFHPDSTTAISRSLAPSASPTGSATPRPLLAKNFGVPESTSRRVSEKEVYFALRLQPPSETGDPAPGPEAAADLQVAALAQRLVVDNKEAGSGWSIPPPPGFQDDDRSAILDLEPGGLRELHWHPTADEWQYVIQGKVSITMFGSGGRYRTETLEKGDVRIPQGYGHSLENARMRPGTSRILIAINLRSGVDRPDPVIAGNPADVLATNFSASRRPCSRNSRRTMCSSLSKDGP